MGSRSPKTPKVEPLPEPPAPDTAAAAYEKSESAKRQKRARGYASTIFGGYQDAGSDRSSSLLKQLLGQ